MNAFVCILRIRNNELKKATVKLALFFVALIPLMLQSEIAQAIPLTMTFDTGFVSCSNIRLTSYAEAGMTVTSSKHLHICENYPGRTQSLRNHQGSTIHPYRFEYLGGVPFDLLSFDLGIRLGWNPGLSTFTSSHGGSVELDTLGTVTFSGTEWRNITWLQWDQGTKHTFRTSNTVMDNLVFQPSIAAVPEPSTFLLLASGLFGLFGLKFRSKKK